MKSKNNNKSVNLNSLTLVLLTTLLYGQVFLSKALSQDRYWFGPDAIEGGPGNWSSTGHWSTTSPAKTSAAAPTTANDAYLQGPSSGVITFSITTAEMRDLYINTSGYTLQSNTTNVNFRLRNFLGSQVSSTTITNTVNTVFNFVIDTGYSTAFTGNFTEGTGTLSLRKQGDGNLDLTGVSTISYTGTTQVDGGTLRMNLGDLSTDNLIIGSVPAYTQGIFETNGNFTRSLGAASGEVRMGFGGSQRGGFSAHGGALNVNFGGSAGTVNWANSGPTNIVLETFVVGTTTSTHTTNVLNSINITAASKTLRTENGAAAIDANFTGAITGTGALNKTGDGVTQFNDYSAGALTISEGTLYINGTISQPTNRTMTVASNATLGGYATTSTSGGLRNTTVQADAIFAPGRGITSGPFGSFSLYGDLDMQTNSVLAFGIGTPVNNDQLVRLGGTWSFDPNQRVTLYDYGIPTSGTFAYPIITGLTADPGVANWTIYNSTVPGGYFYYDSGTVYYLIPEAGHMGLIALAMLLVGLTYRIRQKRPARCMAG